MRPFRHNRLDKLEKQLQRAADEDSPVLVVVDGVYSMEGDLAPLPDIVALTSEYGARLMVDEAHGAGVLGARGAGACELLRRRGRRSTCGWGRSRSRWRPAAASSPARHEVIDFLRIQARAFLFTASGVPAAVGAALAALRIVRSDEGPQLFAQVLDNARYLRDGLHDLGFQVGEVEAAVVPALVGDDWKAVLLWRALYDAGVYVNVALHPAVPPSGALLRTSVMATHDRADPGPRAGHLRPGQAGLRGRARPVANPIQRRCIAVSFTRAIVNTHSDNAREKACS